MRLTSTAEMDCSIARALDVVGEWWTLLIVRDIGINEIHRFDQLQRNLGIARNVLAARLAKLAEHGVIESRRYQNRPPRSEYLLTAKGRELATVLFSLMDWGDKHLRAESDVPPLALEHDACGHRLRVATACPDCDVIVGDDHRHLVHRAAG